MMRMPSSRFNRQRGSAAVEFAILLFPVLLLGFGVVEYGRAVYQYNNVVKSVRSAVRVMSQHSPADSSYAARMVQAQCMAVYGVASCTDGSGTALAPGLRLSHIKICDSISWSDCAGSVQADYKNVTTGLGTMNLVAVRLVGYQFSFLGLPLVGAPATVPFGPIEAVMRQAG